jgi:hypothetical protein
MVIGLDYWGRTVVCALWPYTALDTSLIHQSPIRTPSAQAPVVVRGIYAAGLQRVGPKVSPKQDKEQQQSGSEEAVSTLRGRHGYHPDLQRTIYALIQPFIRWPCLKREASLFDMRVAFLHSLKVVVEAIPSQLYALKRFVWEARVARAWGLCTHRLLYVSTSVSANKMWNIFMKGPALDRLASLLLCRPCAINRG